MERNVLLSYILFKVILRDEFLHKLLSCKVTHRAAACCGGWPTKSSCCWRVRGEWGASHRPRIRWWWSDSPLGVMGFTTDHLPTPPLPALAAPQWLMLMTVARSSLPCFPQWTLGTEPLGWGESKFGALWNIPSDHWQGGGGAECQRGRGKGGFYITWWKIPRRETDTCFCYFCLPYIPPSFSLLFLKADPM